MLHLDVLTMGNEFKDSSGEIYKVTSNFSEGNKMFIEIEKVVNEPIEELINE